VSPQGVDEMNVESQASNKRILNVPRSGRSERYFDGLEEEKYHNSLERLSRELYESSMRTNGKSSRDNYLAQKIYIYFISQ